MVKTFSSHAPQKAFTDGIRSRSLILRSEDLDATGCCDPRKTRPEFAIIIPKQIPWSFPIRSRLSQRLGYPGIGQKSCHAHVDDLPRLQFDDEEGQVLTVNRNGTAHCLMEESYSERGVCLMRNLTL
jgi:hypothetical protein